MSPKKSPAKKPAAKKTARAPKAESPMRKIEHAVGPRPDALAEQARAAHEPPPVEAPRRAPAVGRSTAPPMNTPPTPSPSSSSVVDEGQR